MVLTAILDILPSFGGDDEDRTEKLKEALAEPRKSVDLTGFANAPELSETGANTAIVDVDLYDADTGEPYGVTHLEFEIEKSTGRRRLANFLEAHGAVGEVAEDKEVDRAELFSGLDDVDGAEVDVTRDRRGNIKVTW